MMTFKRLAEIEALFGAGVYFRSDVDEILAEVRHLQECDRIATEALVHIESNPGGLVSSIASDALNAIGAVP